MIKTKEVHQIRFKSEVLLPFRAIVKPCEVSGCVTRDKWETKFILSYPEKLQILDNLEINTELCTLVKLESFQPFDGGIEKAKIWFKKNSNDVFNTRILPKLNHFLLWLKYCNPTLLNTGIIRNVGNIDIIYCNLICEGETIFARVNSTFLQGLNKSSSTNLYSIMTSGIKIDEPIAKEWSVLTRYVDLVNHGYFIEGFIVGFALLDEMVQEFLKTHFPNITLEEAEDLLRRIESQRLKTFLGALCRLCIGESPLDNKSLKTELTWLNDTRNKIMHDGGNCKREDAQRGLKAVLNILKFLKEKGNTNYQLPEELEFWTN